ncbi:MAG: hypothetical protein HWN79_10250 [Candidatus Lokiarchaeota archaeon]|nr:hypothetical protein [Candidatus Lokiarchaeota archaeon]
MPRGTIRAIITLMIVLFPFNYIIWPAQIPSEIISSIFILVAFYFEARKGEDYTLKIIAEVKNPEKAAEEKKKIKLPLYLPKYSVRISLLIILVIYYLIDIFVQNISLELTNTLIDILIIAILYFIGTFFRTIGQLWHKKKLKEQIEAIPNYIELSKYIILEKLNKSKRGGVNNVFKSIFSVFVFVVITTSLLLFTTDTDFVLIFNVSLRRALLLLINLYYGFRD